MYKFLSTLSSLSLKVILSSKPHPFCKKVNFRKEISIELRQIAYMHRYILFYRSRNPIESILEGGVHYGGIKKKL